MKTEEATRETQPSRKSELADALGRLHSRLAAATEAAGRKGSEIELLPITKFFPATDVAILFELGCSAFGESREQEASAKIAEVTRLVRPDAGAIHWHMVGQIQRNKARSLARWAHTIHSVSSSRVVTALDRGVSAARDEGSRTEPLRVYLQLSLDGNVSRGGVDISVPGPLDALCAQVEESPNLELIGLMAIPPLNWDPDEAFTRLQAEHARVLQAYPNAAKLSAGMSNDLEAAIKHGSTCVRVGTALLGRRPLRSP